MPEAQAIALNSVSTAVKEQNILNKSIAQDYIASLRLTEQGYEYIETACLEELDIISNDEDGLLTSISVLVPTAETSTPSYFGTYKGTDFYADFYMEYEKTFIREVPSNDETLQHWANGAFDLVVGYAFSNITLPFSILRQLMSAPGNYQIKPAAFLQSCYKLEARCRGMYVEKLPSYVCDSTFRMLTSEEVGTVYPYTVFHDGETPPQTWQVDFNAQTVYTANYHAQMESAYSWLHLGAGNVLKVTFTEYPPSFSWVEK